MEVMRLKKPTVWNRIKMWYVKWKYGIDAFEVLKQELFEKEGICVMHWKGDK